MSPHRASLSASHDPSGQRYDPTRAASSDHEQGVPYSSIRKRRYGTLPQQEVGAIAGPELASDGSPASERYEHGPHQRNTAVPPKKSRISSGFLLEHAGIPRRLASLSRPKNSGGKARAKPSGDSSGLATSNGASYQSRLSSVGSSPLATKVSTLENTQNGSMSRSALDGQNSGRSGVSSNSNRDSTTLADGAGESDYGAKPSYKAYETDPTQIVNMALSLNEGRRRQVSGKRLASGDNGIRRHGSAGRHLNYTSARRQSSLPQHLHVRDHPPPSISTDTRTRDQFGPSKAYEQSRGSSGSYLQSSPTEDSETDILGEVLDVSDATLARAQKAKEYFELSYEHRRLLRHLPPLRRPVEASQAIYSEGRAYNPLQCARNRKLRFSEKKAPKSDVEGWDDIHGVRNWVNAIIESHNVPRSDPDHCMRLPTLTHVHTGVDEANKDPTESPSPIPSLRRRDTHPVTKHRRQRSDWIVSPEDLLADVCWLEQGLNKVKIEDRDGSKIYPGNTPLKYSGWRSGNLVPDQGQRPPSAPPDAIKVDKHRAIPASARSPPKLPTFTSTNRKGKQRGRERRREARMGVFNESDTSESESQTKRKRFKKNLIRPFNRSSLSESDQGGKKNDRRREVTNVELEREATGSSSESGGLDDDAAPNMLDEETRPIALSNLATKAEEFVRKSQSSATNHFDESSSVSIGRERISPKKDREADHRSGSPRGNLHKTRRSRLSLDIERAVRSSLDYDSTAENSPSVPRFPGIASNLSPPATRSPSPVKKLLYPLRDRNHSKRRMGVGTADLADTPPSPASCRRDSEIAKQVDGSAEGFRDVSPATRISRRSSDSVVAAEEHLRPLPYGITARASARSANPLDAMTRIRGIFRGGRIGELVGNEVSRVGDFVWRRESPSGTDKATFSPNAEGGHISDREHVQVTSRRRGSSPFRTGRPYPAAEQSSKIAVTPGQLRPGLRDRPSYMINNLPTFSSPFQRERDGKDDRNRAGPSALQPSPPNLPSGSEHVPRAVARLRSSSRSSPVDRHKVNPSPGSSPSPPAAVAEDRRRRQNRGLGKQKSSVDPVNASKVLSRVVSQGESPGSNVKRRSDAKQNWNLSFDRQASGTEASNQPSISQKEIARTHALLLSARVKAHQISVSAKNSNNNTTGHQDRHHHHKHKYNQPHHDNYQQQQHHPFLPLLSTLSSPASSAQPHMQSLSNNTTDLRQTLKIFTTTTLPSIHTTLSQICNNFSSTLTPHVLALSDTNTELGVKLTTTSTLAVQELNERIEAALRRKRRGRRGLSIRWSRRVGYLVVEWAVVGLLWAIWFIVFAVRLLVGVGRGVGRAGRWLVWL